MEELLNTVNSCIPENLQEDEAYKALIKIIKDGNITTKEELVQYVDSEIQKEEEWFLAHKQNTVAIKKQKQEHATRLTLLEDIKEDLIEEFL